MKKVLTIMFAFCCVLMVSACVPNKYNINFLVDGEVYISSQFDDNGIELPTEPTKEGYTFAGWYFDDEFEIPFDKHYYQNKKPTQTVNVYAKFTINVYSITFDTNCDLVKDPISANYNTTVSDLPYLSRKGYEFCGWYTDDDTFINCVEELTLTSNVELHAKWRLIEYTITYVFEISGAKNHPMNVSSYTIEDGDILFFDPTPPLLYVFKGWYKYSNGSGDKIYNIKAGSTGNITIYAYIIPASQA